MLRILALDASTEVCSVAVNNGEQVISRYCDTPKSHSKELLPLIDEVLREAGIALNNLDAIAVARGPGSFTGIRIGLGIVQGLSYGANLPIVGVNTLEVMVQGYRDQSRDDGSAIYVPALDARMGEVYWAAYLSQQDSFSEKIISQVSSPEVLRKQLEQVGKARSVVAIGHGWTVEELNGLEVSVLQPEFKPHANAVLTLANQIIKKAGSLDHFSIAAIEPIYLRNEVTWQKRQRIRTSDV
ncbi:tRNA (adenosine(37)-N6)-threonylcarbamoyltransferase complex dimerization subunit type 1 TsaB [Teredinibacter haidensis]|uniref:tRNA (adenosine(37)-N6)-threonylcarbamoyltransferase complex dimerization subunit type 1 TsaB n=1 Tax=Teredinibacter haidensis TaxID=2731755 RepID=UPI0009489A90|nr:tRNA (adenosine(37)-N6)-threonylcarbamoyltransferase complex dimerization subunit type 1 TsaB [Teredinibacter haidensis]